MPRYPTQASSGFVSELIADNTKFTAMKIVSRTATTPVCFCTMLPPSAHIRPYFWTRNSYSATTFDAPYPWYSWLVVCGAVKEHAVDDMGVYSALPSGGFSAYHYVYSVFFLLPPSSSSTDAPLPLLSLFRIKY